MFADGAIARFDSSRHLFGETPFLPGPLVAGGHGFHETEFAL